MEHAPFSVTLTAVCRGVQSMDLYPFIVLRNQMVYLCASAA